MVAPRTKDATPVEPRPSRTAKRPSARPTVTPATKAETGPAKAGRRAGSGIEALERDLVAAVKRHNPQADTAGIVRAVALAVEAHGSQRRASGEPFVTHPIASAQILAELGVDPVAIEAALLHDVPEDTEFNLADIEERFGQEVAHLVDGVTKLGKFSTLSHEQQQA